jgi:hypothetical protein
MRGFLHQPRGFSAPGQGWVGRDRAARRRSARFAPEWLEPRLSPSGLLATNPVLLGSSRDVPQTPAPGNDGEPPEDPMVPPSGPSYPY